MALSAESAEIGQMRIFQLQVSPVFREVASGGTMWKD